METESIDQVGEIISWYHQKAKGVHGDELMKCLVRLRTHLFRLTEMRIEAHNKWLEARHQVEGSEAAKDRHADNEVKELYQLRYIIKAASDVAATMSQQLKILTDEKKQV